MHGRLKIKTTAEQQAEKEKERAVKRKLYLAALDQVFSKRRENTCDQECLSLSAQLLYANPDAATIWNIRREVLLTFKSDVDEDGWQKLCEDELKMTEQCLVKNPKSYGAWHHRDWVLGHTPLPPFIQEIRLCDQYLQKDPRNFHCWDHRRTIVSMTDRSVEEELQMTQEMIEANFSNYSAWHYRSKLLPLVHPPPKHSPHPVPEQVFLKELTQVVTAVFTDPSDQSPWFYLQWLLGSSQQHPPLLQVGVVPPKRGSSETELVLVFGRKVSSCEGVSIVVRGVDGEQVHTDTLRAHSTDKCIWYVYVPSSCYDCSLSVEVRVDGCDHQITLEGSLSPRVKGIEGRGLRREQISDKAKSSLQQIVETCVTLDDIDPGNKWVLLSLVNLLSTLGEEIGEKVRGYLDQLQHVDPLRVCFYQDLRSKLELESKYETSLRTDCVSFEAPQLKLSRVVNPQYLCFVETIDLSGNNIRSVSPMCSFLCCIRLILDGNPVEDLSPLKRLSRLQELSLNSCGINSLKGFEGLQGNDVILKLFLEDNPVTSLEHFNETLKGILKSLVQVEC